MGRRKGKKQYAKDKDSCIHDKHSLVLVHRERNCCTGFLDDLSRKGKANVIGKLEGVCGGEGR